MDHRQWIKIRIFVDSVPIIGGEFLCFDYDPHIIYVVCRDGICSFNNRCGECESWYSALIKKLRKQFCLKFKRENKSRKAKTSTAPIGSGISGVINPYVILRQEIGGLDNISLAP